MEQPVTEKGFDLSEWVHVPSVGAWVIVDAFWGDSGKGLISAYLTAREKMPVVFRAGVGPNAEHGLFTADEKVYIRVNQLPLGFIFSDADIIIGSGTCVNPTLLLEEIQRFGLKRRVFVDYRCPIITPEHIQAEKDSKGLKGIGSMLSGSGFCRADFVLRKAKQARNVNELREIILDCAEEINQLAWKESVCIESSQGTFLSLAVTPDYPQATSDNVTTLAACDDVGLNWKYLKESVLVVKALPSREGVGGTMGEDEYTDEEIRELGLEERNSLNDGSIRRKAKGINFELLKYAARINGSTQVALTFCEQYDKEIKNAKRVSDITPKTWELIEKIENELDIPVTILNTGKGYNNIIDRVYEDAVDWSAIDKKIETYRRAFENV